MRIVKVRALNQRPASNLSVLVQFLFNRHMPGEFQPGYEYNKGDTVYTISEDGLSIKLWTCNIGGAYANTKEPYWTEFSLSSYLNERLAKIIKTLYEPHPQMYSLGQKVGTKFVSNMGDGLEYIGNTPPYMDAFYGGKLIPPNTYEIVDGVFRDLDNMNYKVSNLMLDCYAPSHDLARLIRRVSFVSSMTSNGVIEIPCRNIHNYGSYGYELTVNGTFIPPEYYTEEITSVGDMVIRINDNVLKSGWISEKNTSSNVNIAIESEASASYNQQEAVNVIDGLTSTSWSSDIMSIVNPTQQWIDLELPIGNESSIIASKVSITFEDIYWPTIMRITTRNAMISDMTQVEYHRETSSTKTDLTIEFEGIITLKKFVRFAFEELNQTVAGDRRIKVREIQIIAPHGGSLNYTAVANFMVSMSDNIDIIHSTLTKRIEKDMDSYDIDITDSGYINVLQTMSIYVNGDRANSDKFHFSKGFLNVKSQSDYLEINDILNVSVMSFIPNKFTYTDINHEDRRYITESVHIVENNTRLVPIPFMEFDEDLDDFLVFNENGALISSAKYYIDNAYIRYYSHDQGVYLGDTLNFKMIDRNKNMIMRTFIITAQEVDQQNFTIPFEVEDYDFVMVFYTAGAYISPNEYTISGNKLVLTHNMALDVDDRLEIIVFKYPGKVGSTVMEYQRIFVDEEIQNKFKLNFQFDPSVTSFLIFANTGLYVGEKFYTISNDNILTIKGEEVYNGGWLDLVVIQSTEALTSEDNILDLL